MPGSGARYVFADRWPGVLQKLFGDRIEVVEAGLNGRTTCFDDGLFAAKNGLKTLPGGLQNHQPLDVVIISLGINDLKAHLRNTANTVAEGAGKLIAHIQQSRCGRNGATPEVLLVSPPSLAASRQLSPAFSNALDESKKLSEAYRIVCEKSEIIFLSGDTAIKASATDGIHYDQDQHRRLAESIASTLSQAGCI